MAKALKSLFLKGWRPATRPAGFSAVELMVVLAVVAVLSGVAAFSLSTSRKAGIQYAVDEMFGAIQDARMRSIRGNQWCTVSFNTPALNQYRISLTNEVVNLGKYRGNVTFGNSPDATDPAPVAQLVFTPQGFAQTPGRVYLNSAEDNTWYRVETSYAGITRVDRWGTAAWN